MRGGDADYGCGAALKDSICLNCFLSFSFSGAQYWNVLDHSCLSKQDWLPFFNSSLAILVVFWMLVGTIYPNIILNTADTQQSLTCFNASSSQSALTAMLIITLLALPVVLFYIAYVYRKFGGKVF